MESALALDDIRKAEGILTTMESVPFGAAHQFLQAHASRFRASICAGRGENEEAERLLKRADGLFRELDFPFYLAVCLLEHGEWLVREGSAAHAEPLLREAVTIFDELQASPWLERGRNAFPTLTEAVS